MASSALHYVISKKVAERIRIRDINSFLLGAVIAPDTGAKEDGSYNSLHFFEYSNDESCKGINWQNYASGNENRMNEDYYLGYYCHLIEDAVWYHDFYYTYIKKATPENRAVRQPAVYRDYQRLNYLLKNELQVSFVPFENIRIPDSSIDPAGIIAHIEYVNGQFAAPECSKEDLEIIPWDFVMEYIGKCEKLCANEILALQGKGTSVDPQNYYVTVS